jgi:hypothetical protein
VHILRRILLAIVVTLAVIFVGMQWIAPIAFSFYSARKAPPITRVVPADLTDLSISPTTGVELSSLGYEFEVPWNDLDDSKTRFHPTDRPIRTAAIFLFRSGMSLAITFLHARESAGLYAKDLELPPRDIRAIFGRGSSYV